MQLRIGCASDSRAPIHVGRNRSGPGVLTATIVAVAAWLIIVPARRRQIVHDFEEKIATLSADLSALPAEPWRVRFGPRDESRYDYWRRMEFTEEEWVGLRRHADDVGLRFISSPFSFEAVDLLERVGLAAWKIASGEVGNRALVERVCRSGQPVLVSSGMSDYTELDDAVALLHGARVPYAVLQCTSAYPCPPERVGLNLIADLRERYDCPVGLSDHSGTIYAGLAAAALGAEVLEVHVTLSREAFGPDVPASVTTGELRQLVDGCAFSQTRGGSTLSPVIDGRGHRAAGRTADHGREVIEGVMTECRDLARTMEPGSGIMGSH